MDLQIALLLGQDGIVNGAIYGLLAVALVLVFSVTRVIFIPQGEFVSFGALTLAMMQTGRVPSTLWLLLAVAALVLVVDVIRSRTGREVSWPASLFWTVLAPGVAFALAYGVRPSSMLLQALTTLAIITPMGPLSARLRSASICCSITPPRIRWCSSLCFCRVHQPRSMRRPSQG